MLAGLLSACSTGGSGSPVANVSGGKTDNLNGIVMPTAYRAPSVSLTDTQGRPFDPSSRPDPPDHPGLLRLHQLP